MPHLLRAASLLSAFLFASSVLADCECGYTVNGTLYTDLTESDFLHMKNINASGWIPETYTVNAKDARGPFGKNASPQQIALNPLKSRYDWAGNGINGGDAGAQVFVRGGNPKDGMIPMGEMTTNRTDILYGSFRAGVKLTGTPGTCGAFFWVGAILSTYHHIPAGLTDRVSRCSTSMTHRRSTWNSSPHNSTRPPTQLILSFNPKPLWLPVSMPVIPILFRSINCLSIPPTAFMNTALIGIKIMSISSQTVHF